VVSAASGPFVSQKDNMETNSLVWPKARRQSGASHHASRVDERRAVKDFWSRAEKFGEQNCAAARMILADMYGRGGEGAEESPRCLSLPSRQYVKDGERNWIPVVEFSSREARDWITNVALAAFDAFAATGAQS
jgi:hypothetical protein